MSSPLEMVGNGQGPVCEDGVCEVTPVHESDSGETD